MPPLDETTFRLPLAAETCPVIEIVPDQIVTRRVARSVRRVEGEWAFDPERDVVLIASIERHRASGRIGLGLVSGFGMTHDGALGSSVAHDSHNLIIAGTNPRDMLICARALAEHGGGFVAASGGTVQALLPLPVAGLLSIEDADTVCRQLAKSIGPYTRWAVPWMLRSARSRSWPYRSYRSCGSPLKASSTSTSNGSSTCNGDAIGGPWHAARARTIGRCRAIIRFPPSGHFANRVVRNR